MKKAAHTHRICQPLLVFVIFYFTAVESIKTTRSTASSRSQTIMGFQHSKFTLDGGYIDLGSLSPQGLYTVPEYNLKLARKFIRQGRLAPFYEGWTEKPNPSIACSKRSCLLSTQVIECPICLLYYPAFINYTRCCNKPICTECFLQFRRSADNPWRPASCPFCTQTNFGVIHVPPTFSPFYKSFCKRRSDLVQDFLGNRSDAKRRVKLGPNDPDVVLVDQLRPDWQSMLSPRNVSDSMSGYGTTRRIVVRQHTRPRQPVITNTEWQEVLI